MSQQETQELRLRLAEMQAALDRVQHAATQAQAEADHYRTQLGIARRDINGFVEEIRDLGDENARLRQELAHRTEAAK